jgi:hypothetical protein
MTEFSYKEACYAFMIAVADEDNSITMDEKYVIDHFFDERFSFLRLSDKSKKEIGSNLRTSLEKEKFHEMIIKALRKADKEQQMKAYDLVCKFVNTNCPKNASAWSVASKLQSKLDFSMDEFKEYIVWKKKS